MRACTAGRFLHTSGEPATILARMESSCLGEDQQGWVCAPCLAKARANLTARGYCLRCGVDGAQHIVYTALEPL